MNGQAKDVDVTQRNGRDVVRIGALLKRGYEVFTISLGETLNAHDNHMNHNFNVLPRKRYRDTDVINMIDDLVKKLDCRKLDYVLDEWVWIPINWPDNKHFFHNNKWQNVIKMAEVGILNDNCKVIIPFHMSAIETFFSKETTSNYLWHQICFWFEPSILPFDNDILCGNHPLWAATQDTTTNLTQISPETQRLFRNMISENLRKYSVHENKGSLRNELWNRCGWREVKPWAAFLVLTLKESPGRI